MLHLTKPFVLATSLNYVMSAGCAHAAITKLWYEVSTDGVQWSSETVVSPGFDNLVLMRARVQHIRSANEPVPYGLGSLSFQPTISNIRPGIDSVLPFANAGGGGVTLDSTPLDGPFGRVSPFAATSPSTSDPYFVHTHIGRSGGAPTGSYYRIARRSITNWIGVGATAGSAAVNNFNGFGGLAVNQILLPGGGLPNYPVNRSLDPVVFQVALHFPQDVSGLGKTSVIDTPSEGLRRDQTSGRRVALWAATADDLSNSIITDMEVSPAIIRFIPAPGTVIALVSGLLCVSRRRR